MWEGVAALNFQIQLINEREKRLIFNQKLLDFRAKSGVFLALEKELETEFVSFFISQECFGATFRQCETN